jgi:hypothetical protein
MTFEEHSDNDFYMLTRLGTNKIHWFLEVEIPQDVYLYVRTQSLQFSKCC